MPIEITVDGPVAIIKGWQAHRLTRAAGLRPIYNGVRAGWVFDAPRVPALTAYLEHRCIRYTVQEPSIRSVPVAVASPSEPEDPQLALFGGAA